MRYVIVRATIDVSVRVLRSIVTNCCEKAKYGEALCSVADTMRSLRENTDVFFISLVRDDATETKRKKMIFTTNRAKKRI